MFKIQENIGKIGDFYRIQDSDLKYRRYIGIQDSVDSLTFKRVQGFNFRKQLTILLRQTSLFAHAQFLTRRHKCCNTELYNTHHVQFEEPHCELSEDELALTRDLYSTIHVTLTETWPVLIAFVPLKVTDNKNLHNAMRI